MKTKILLFGALIAGILSAFFGGRVFATAGDTVTISGGKAWDVCVDASDMTVSSNFVVNLAKSGFESQLAVSGSTCKTVTLESGSYTASLGQTMGASATSYEISGDTLTFSVTNSLNKYLHAIGSIAYMIEGSGEEESDFELLFSMPGECQLNGNANVSGETCKDGDGNPLTNKKYIDTGVALFSEGNAARDFEIYFTLDDYASTQPNNQGTLFNAKYEDSSMLYPGFTLRMSGSNVQTMELTGRIGNDNTDADKAKKDIRTASLKGKEMKIVRVGGLVSYSIDGGELIEFQNYQNFSRYFEQSAVFGASLQPNGTPQRYYDGTVSNIRIYLKKVGSIEFNANGGTGTMATIENKMIGTDVVLPANTFTKSRAAFTGWNTEADGSGADYADEATVTISSEDTLTLYAQWEDIQVGSVEFNANGGTGTMTTIEDIPVGTNTTLPANTFAREGYEFAGWNTAADGTGTDYADEAEVTITFADTLTLYAQWAEKVPTGSIEFNANRGSGTMAAIEDVPVGVDVTLPTNTYSLTNATFKGWNTRLDGTGTDYTDGGTVTISSTDRITLYAQWDGKAVLDEGTKVNEKLKRIAGNYYHSYTDSDSRIKAIKTADALPDGFETLNTSSYIISAGIYTSPIPIYAWYDNSDLDNDGQGDGVIYLFTTADKMESGSDMNYVCNYMTSLSDISALADIDVSSASGFARLFSYTESLTNVSAVADWNTSNVNNLNGIFEGASSLLDISALANWDVKKVKYMHGAFEDATSLKDISALSRWNTKSLTTITYMFKNADSITTLSGVENWDISHVESINEAFAYMDSLNDISALGSWDMSNVEEIRGIFSHDTSLANILPLASWNTSNITVMNYLFSYTAITNTDALETKQYEGKNYVSWDTSNVKEMKGLFERASSLSDISALSSWNTSSLIDMGGMFMYTSITDISPLETKQHEGKNYVSWDTSSIEGMATVFCGVKNITDISPLASWNTGNVLRMGSMFYGVSSLVDISPLASWNTSKVTGMAGMFSGTAITNTDALETKQHEGKNYVSWDTSSVTTIASMFSRIKTLTNISKLSSWNTSSVVYMNNIFEETSPLSDFSALASWNTASVVDMSKMFVRSKISDLSAFASWNTSSVTNMSYMFQYAGSLTSLTGLAGWDTSNVENMSYMFQYASSLSDVTAVNDWDVSKTTVSSRRDMFYYVPATPLPSWY